MKSELSEILAKATCKSTFSHNNTIFYENNLYNVILNRKLVYLIDERNIKHTITIDAFRILFNIY